MEDYGEILLIEDNPNDAELILRALNKKGLDDKCNWIKDGEEAYEFLISKKHQVLVKIKTRLILLDLKLPKVSGIQILNHIKSDKILKTIPVVILTSSKEDKDLSECYSLGANSYIVKPVDYKEFMTTVSEIGAYWLNLNEPLK